MYGFVQIKNKSFKSPWLQCKFGMKMLVLDMYFSTFAENYSNQQEMNGFVTNLYEIN